MQPLLLLLPGPPACLDGNVGVVEPPADSGPEVDREGLSGRPPEPPPLFIDGFLSFDLEVRPGTDRVEIDNCSDRSVPLEDLTLSSVDLEPTPGSSND